jgi:thiamine transporter
MRRDRKDGAGNAALATRIPVPRMFMRADPFRLLGCRAHEGEQSMRNTRVLTMVETALCVALAVVLARIILFEAPQGGAISLEMLPVMVLALRRGARAGLIAGVLTGVALLMFKPITVHWAQVALDYPLAFGAIGLTALGAGAWRAAVAGGRTARAVWTVVVPACVLGGAARFVPHFISGVIFFGQYAPKGQPVVLYSLLYNGGYMLPATIICTAAAALLVPAL